MTAAEVSTAGLGRHLRAGSARRSPHVEDTRILNGVRRRRTAMLRAAIERHGDHVFATTLRFLPEPEVARELAEDVFVRLWTDPDSVAGAARDLRIALMQTARGAALAHLGDLQRSRNS